MLVGAFVVVLTFISRFRAGISLLIGYSLNAIVNLVSEDNEDRLVVTDVAVKSFG